MNLMLENIASYSFVEFLQGTYWILIDQPIWVFVFPLVNIPILILLGVGICHARKTGNIFPKRFFAYIGIAFLFPLSSAILGALFYDTQADSLSLISLVFLLALVCLIGWQMYIEKGRRFLLLGIGAIFVVWDAITLFVAAMSISNTWL